MRVRLELDGVAFEVELRRTPEGFIVSCEGDEFPARVQPHREGLEVELGPQRHRVRFPAAGLSEIDGVLHRYEVGGFQPGGDEAASGPGAKILVRAQMPGRVVKILAAPGSPVSKGTPLLVLEAMKMQNELLSPASGTLSQILARPGDVVEFGRVLAHLEPGQKS